MTRSARLLDFKHQALQVFGLGQVQHYGMVGRSAAPLKQAHSKRCANSGAFFDLKTCAGFFLFRLQLCKSSGKQ